MATVAHHTRGRKLKKRRVNLKFGAVGPEVGVMDCHFVLELNLGNGPGQRQLPMFQTRSSRPRQVSTPEVYDILTANLCCKKLCHWPPSTPRVRVSKLLRERRFLY